ncbi:MAG: phosphomannomutase [Verrucomicrobiales bacterium]|nr:phosphomannomutase [Verrucomicrobiales bacterium]
MRMEISVRQMMETSGVKFGTSGARGLATDMTDLVCHVYTQGFLQYLRSTQALKQGSAVAIAGDFRPSTGRIMEAVAGAAADAGYQPVRCGKIPSPAVALYGLSRGIPAIMVTGSHIPDDRNGIKFNKVEGEILKSDEPGIMDQVVAVHEGRFDSTGHRIQRVGSTPHPAGPDLTAAREYTARYLEAFPGRPLTGLRVGVYQHSAVGRDFLVEVLEALGAETVALGRSATFIPVDTEAIRPEDVVLAADWARQHEFSAIVSTDGDSDRPLISDERGVWLRGDVTGVLTAHFLKADSVSTPVSSNSVVEQCRWFADVRRTRIGSPYVIESLQTAEKSGRERVVGYEANGGFMVQTDLTLDGRLLKALPTRDALLPILSVLLLAKREEKRVSELVAGLPDRFTASDRLKDFPVERGRTLIARLSGGSAPEIQAAIQQAIGNLVGARVNMVDLTDGVRAGFENGEIVHLRPSGNAPEFRCYTEASSVERAEALCHAVLARVARGGVGLS